MPATSRGPKAHQPFNPLITQLTAAGTRLLLSRKYKIFPGPQFVCTLLTRGVGSQCSTIKDYTEAHSFTAPAKGQGYT